MEKNKKNIIAYILSTLVFVAGAYLAALLVYDNASKPINDKPKKDTVYVNLLNQPYQLPAASINNITPVSTPQSTASPVYEYKKPFKPKEDKVHLQPQTGRWLPSNTPDPVAITGLEKNIASTMAQTYFRRKTFSFNVICGSLAGLLILFASFFIKKEKYMNAEAKDADPPEIEALFNDTYYKEQIGLFRNPRKILRFKNIVRYHYYFLKAAGITDKGSLQKLMLILLGIQDDMSLVDISKISPTKLSEPEWFYDKIKTKPWFTESHISLKKDEKLMMTILKLNVDMGT